MIEAETIIGELALSFTVRGSWAHFRKVEANRTKMTYRIPPRTTVAGMLAAIAGYPRDSYYDLYGPDVSAIAIGVHSEHPIRTFNMPINSVDTRNDVAENGEKVTVKIKTDVGAVKLPNPDATRQRYAYEFIPDPAYQIDVWLADDDAYQDLREQLFAGRARYGPSLGLSECLAYIRPDEVAEHTIEAVEPTADGGSNRDRDEYGRRVRGVPSLSIDSAVPEPGAVVEQPGTTVVSERSPGWMTIGDNGRKTTGWIDWRLDPTGGQLAVRTDDGAPATPIRIGDRKVIMV